MRIFKHFNQNIRQKILFNQNNLDGMDKPKKKKKFKYFFKQKKNKFYKS